MKNVGAALGRVTLNGAALLPFWVLYGISDIIFLLAYYVVRYRRRLVRSNLAACFPEKSDTERRHIERRFYRSLGDYAVETLKIARMSDKIMRRHLTFENISEIDDALDRGRSVAAYFSHCGQWEWVTSITLWSSHGRDPQTDFCQVYRPLRNKFFDKFFLRLRSHFGSFSLKKREVARDLLKIKHAGRYSVTGFMSDQKPSHLDPVYVIKFLGRPTPVITGTEQLARRMDMTVVYLDMFKERRGHYRVVVRKLSDNPSSLPEHDLTKRYFAMLEETIRRNPAIWLWTHNRWKNHVTLNE